MAAKTGIFLLVVVVGICLGLSLPPEPNPDLLAPARDVIPPPYHSTDDILRFVEQLARDCQQGENFRLDLVKDTNLLDLERDTSAAPNLHGKADMFFDAQLAKHQTALLELSSTEEVPKVTNALKPGIGVPQQSFVQTTATAPKQQQADMVPPPQHHSKTQQPPPQIPSSWLNKTLPPTELPVLHVSLPGPKGNKPKAMILFGEHGRELISCEIGMEFIQSLADAVCLATPETTEVVSLLDIEDTEYAKSEAFSASQIRTLLSNWDLVILPIVSPSAREIAEKHNFCNRKNSDNIDVNRNYPFHFGEGQRTEQSDQFAGDTPLSEPETRIAATVAKETKPHLFMAVHSGAELIVTSPAYRNFKLDDMPRGVQKVVRAVQQQDCPECETGPASEVLPYLAHGCSMDFMFEQGFADEQDPAHPTHQHFSFTFETWSGDKEKDRVANVDLEKLFGGDEQRISEVKEQTKIFDSFKDKVGKHEFMCLRRFNPPPSLYPLMRHRWTKALFSTLHAVGQELVATSP